ncbi:DoxX family protein [Spirosoma panaciterrae]|uniref:DoxX family protein n=1 Tax=Spirosoma panaciterrae TaxID=496058 RepID=UPI00037A0AC7|nr:DoxX family protein [Spirosoma panaciterrae]
MVTPKKTARVLHSVLWIVQTVLAASFIWAAWMKLFQPIDKLAAMWPWTGQIPTVLVKAIGVLDLLGAIGVLLPSLLRIWPSLTVVAACGIVVQMVCASIFHLVRGEGSVIGANVVFALMAAFVAWSRLSKAPIPPV